MPRRGEAVTVIVTSRGTWASTWLATSSVGKISYRGARRKAASAWPKPGTPSGVTTPVALYATVASCATLAVRGLARRECRIGRTIRGFARRECRLGRTIRGFAGSTWVPDGTWVRDRPDYPMYCWLDEGAGLSGVLLDEGAG